MILKILIILSLITFSASASQDLRMYKCTESDRAKKCTEGYVGVCCGWYKENIQCFAYPCTSNYGNKCHACRDPNVAYVTDGACPEIA